MAEVKTDSQKQSGFNQREARHVWRVGQLNFGLRLTLLTLTVVLPIIAAALFFMVSRAATVIEVQGAEQLHKTNQAMAGNVTIWLNQQAETLNTLVAIPDVISMDANQQTPLLKSFQSGHPNVYLVHTMDITGMNVARNDGGELKDYKDRGYFTGPVSGTPIVFQSLISRTTGQPAVCMGAPIQSQSGKLVGVGSICSELTEISQGVQVIKVGETGFAYVVDEKNQVVAHPDPAYTAELSDFSQYPPVAMLRSGQKGLVTFTDDQGEAWHAYIEELDNGWGVITQQKDSEHLATLVSFRTISIITLLIGVVIIAATVWFILQRAVKPVKELTSIAEAISTGDLTQVASVGRTDELGVLARSFNSMTTQLRDLIGSLEQRVAERTKALATSAEVSRRLTSILDPNELAREVVNQIQSAFNYYYAQIYLYDAGGENLVLTAGTGEAGAEMMKRGHRLPKGRGLVGRSAENNESVLVSDTSQDPNWLPNQLLPDTKAEAAIPIAIGDRVLGVLDVQDDVTNDISPEDITLLESLAGQVAISIQNADLYGRAETALQEAKSLIDYAAEGILVLDLTNGLFAEGNENASKIYGLPHDELMKVGPAQMSPPTQPNGRDSTEAAMEQIGIAMEKGTNIFEWVHINGRGEEFPAEIRLVRLPGDHPRMRVTVTDITERQALQKLTAQRARQQEAINTITQKIQSATTIEEAMQVAARELGHAIGNRQTLVTLEPSALGGNGKTTVNE